MLIRVLVLTLLAASICSCGDEAVHPPLEIEEPRLIPFQSVGAPRVEEQMLVVIRYEEEWEQFWALHSDGREVTPPPVDFESKMLAGVFFGLGFFGCEEEAEIIDEVYTDGSVVQVIVGAIPWLGECRTTAYPRNMVEFDRLNQPVIFAGEIPTSFRVLVDSQLHDHQTTPGGSLNCDIENVSQGKIYMLRCPIFVERYVGGTWQVELWLTTPCSFPETFDAMQPGAVLTMNKRFDVNAPYGEYRLSVNLTRYPSSNAERLVYKTESFLLAPNTSQENGIEPEHLLLQPLTAENRPPSRGGS